ncbi:MAG: DUF1801 domain-containing protein [Candidatus Eisenbacteria bacterium]|nr:DUF1801 domain-containing protein [Candidatus Eisenbacteria bacterium]MCC7140608.1 DUF1801 domain-containing protein [Candidatus Eisenbacteria bacterium]
MQSKAKTVQEYLKSLPEDRRAAIEAVRKVVLANLDRQFEEGMQYGMIGFYVPHSVFPPGYHCDPKQPLPFAALASQKNYMSLYLMSLYMNSEAEARFTKEWAKTGKKLDMGKSCIRFTSVDALALEVIAEHLRRVTAQLYIETYLGNLPPAKRPSWSATGATGRPAASVQTAARQSPAKRSPAKNPPAKKSPAGKPAVGKTQGSRATAAASKKVSRKMGKTANAATKKTAKAVARRAPK